ncbi:metallophosphoesterase family protein [soil metagenome]
MVLGRFGLKFSKAPRTDPGDRVYAIGDIHGRIDLLNLLLAKMEAHSQSLPPCQDVHVIILGDMIDRGPHSAEVVSLIRKYQRGSSSLIALKGNHEDLLLQALEGYPGILRAWMKTGGEQTLRSFGIDPAELGDNPLEAARIIERAIPAPLIGWIRDLPLTARSGDYFFCHAGIRPGVALRKQASNDLMWIREDFLNHEGDHGAVIVHGHNIHTEVQMHANRIGIDTGAYRSGVLTALYLEDDKREILSVGLPASDAARARVAV